MHHIVAVKNVNIFACCTVDAGFEVPEASDISRLTVVFYTSLSNGPYNRFHISIGTMVIDYFNLHELFAHVLL
jgi:hypothetical protein